MTKSEGPINKYVVVAETLMGCILHLSVCMYIQAGCQILQGMSEPHSKEMISIGTARVLGY